MEEGTTDPNKFSSFICRVVELSGHGWVDQMRQLARFPNV